MQREASFDGCRLEIVCQVVIRTRLPFPHDDGDKPMRSSRHRLREHLSLVEDEFVGRCISRVRILALLENDDISVFLGKIDQTVKTRPQSPGRSTTDVARNFSRENGRTIRRRM